MIKNATRDNIQFVRGNTIHKKDEHTIIKRTEIWQKKETNRVACFNIYTIVFSFLSCTVEEGRW